MCSLVSGRWLFLLYRVSCTLMVRRIRAKSLTWLEVCSCVGVVVLTASRGWEGTLWILRDDSSLFGVLAEVWEVVRMLWGW